MSSKASEWAARFKDASFALGEVKNDRPTAFTFHLVGRAGLSLYVDDYGRPTIAITGVTEDMEVSIYAEHDQNRLLEAARWILDTFGETTA